jgi:regulator of protease activity HflC (stomatin/prohibitin superfamily)
MDLDDALSSRDHIKAKLKAAISDDISDWGITLKTVEIQDIQPLTPCKLRWKHKQRLNVNVVQR